MVKREKQIEKVSNAILTGARGVFVRSGYSGASISMIAKAAGISQGLIYHYFKDKIHLWKEVKKAALNEGQVKGDFGAAEAKTFRAFLEIVVAERFRFYRENPDIRVLLAWEKLQSVDNALLGTEDHFEGIWHKELSHLQSIGEMRGDVDPKLVSIFLLSAIAGVFDYMPAFFSKTQRATKQQEYLRMIIDEAYRSFGI